jgi:hypothetical protein
VNYAATSSCFQVGPEGNLSFTSDHSGYDFILEYGYGDGGAGHALIFTGNYSCPAGAVGCGS